MVNFQSHDWEFVKQKIETWLANKRTAIESPTMSYRDTIEARGYLRALKDVLKLPQDIFEITAANNKR